VIGNKYDPVTPYTSAIETTRIMNEGHASPNAVLLTSNGIGHCSNGQASSCVNNYIRDYLINGTLPPHGTICEPDEDLFSNKLKRPLFVVNRLGRRTTVEDDLKAELNQFHSMKTNNFIF
jgi:hypothetical protein